MSYVAKEQGWVGRQFNRKEDYRLTTGKGQYFCRYRRFRNASSGFCAEPARPCPHQTD